MRLLLDTHIFLWCVVNDRRLTAGIKAKILDAQEVYISSVSIWEMAIKISLRKFSANIENLIQAIHESHFLELPVTAHHAAATLHLPDLHRDPFDRLLIAQAVSEPLTFLTADTTLKGYSELVELVK